MLALNCVMLSLRVFQLQDIHSKTFGLLLLDPYNDFRVWAKGVIFKGVSPFSSGLIISSALTCFPRFTIHEKNYCAIARRKSIPFYLARTSINFPNSQPANYSQCSISQLAQILPEERVFCRRLRWVLLVKQSN